jgi:hypothetical protein
VEFLKRFNVPYEPKYLFQFNDAQSEGTGLN